MNELPLKELSGQRGNPCISVILSTRLKSFDDKERIKLKLKNALGKVRKKLKDKFDEDLSDNLFRRVSSVCGKIDLRHPHNGVGVYVSGNYSNLIYFPLPVRDRIIIDSSFEIRDIMANLKLLSPYMVLLLNKRKSRLYKGSGVELTEVSDGHFPLEYKDDLLLKKSPPGFPFTEESRVNQARMEKYFRQVDHALKSHLTGNPLVLVGLQKHLYTFKSVSRFVSMVIGELSGNHDRLKSHEIARQVFPIIEAWHKKEERKTIDKAIEAVLSNKAVSGIQEVWTVARQGSGSELIVERDFACKAFLGKGDNELILEDGNRDALTEIPDAIEAVIDELMEQHDVRIHFVENGVLKEYGRIILITRY